MFTNHPHIDNNNERQKLKSIVEKALGKLPHEYRMIFSLIEINQLSELETANLLNLTPSNIKVRLNKAKVMLRREIEMSYSPTKLFEFNLIYCDAMVENVMNKINKL